MPKKSGVLYGKGKENKEFPTVISTTAEQSVKISRPIASGHSPSPWSFQKSQRRKIEIIQKACCSA